MTNEQLEIEKELKEQHPDLHRIECPACGELVIWAKRKLISGEWMLASLFIKTDGSQANSNDEVPLCKNKCHKIYRRHAPYNGSCMRPAP